MRVTLLEKRADFTRARRVKLLGKVLLPAPTDDEPIIFSDDQVVERRRAIDCIKLELFAMTTSWLEIATPIQIIQEKLLKYYVAAGGTILTGDQYDFKDNLKSLTHYPNTVIIDCTGYHSVLRNHIQPDNRVSRLLEHVLLCSFILDTRYECNERCKYYKNRNTRRYRIIPSINDTYTTGERQTNVLCLITIDQDTFEELSLIKPLTYASLGEHKHEIYDDLNIFLNNLCRQDLSKIRFDTMEFVTLPLQLYRAKKLTYTVNDSDLNQHWVLLGDAAMGGPYFQSISMGFESAIYLAYLLVNMNGNAQEVFKKYEMYVETLWLRLQMHSREIQHNKQILQAMCADDRDAVLELIKIF